MESTTLYCHVLGKGISKPGTAIREHLWIKFVCILLACWILGVKTFTEYAISHMWELRTWLYQLQEQYKYDKKISLMMNKIYPSSSFNFFCTLPNNYAYYLHAIKIAEKRNTLLQYCGFYEVVFKSTEEI